MKPILESISTQKGHPRTLLGYPGPFPRGRGNTLCLVSPDHSTRYMVNNLSHEDLVDALKLNLIGDTVDVISIEVEAPENLWGEHKFDVYKEVVVIDTRLPQECLNTARFHRFIELISPGTFLNRIELSVEDWWNSIKELTSGCIVNLDEELKDTNMQTQQIPVLVGTSSCVGFNSCFPRGGGNYISTYDHSTGVVYEVVNLSYEDLTDAINLGIIDTLTIEAEVYDHDQSDKCKVAFITDKRFPSICLTPEWWYGIRSEFMLEILHRKYDIPKGVCLCEFEESRHSGITYYSFLHTSIPGCIEKHGKCKECNKEFRSVERKKD